MLLAKLIKFFKKKPVENCGNCYYFVDHSDSDEGPNKCAGKICDGYCSHHDDDGIKEPLQLGGHWTHHTMWCAAHTERNE